jgi:hypothetical protein
METIWSYLPEGKNNDGVNRPPDDGSPNSWGFKSGCCCSVELLLLVRKLQRLSPPVPVDDEDPPLDLHITWMRYISVLICFMFNEYLKMLAESGLDGKWRGCVLVSSMRSKGIRPLDSTRPGVEWLRPRAAVLVTTSNSTWWSLLTFK